MHSTDAGYYYRRTRVVRLCVLFMTASHDKTAEPIEQ